ncbi:hypothetical protein PI124_g18298 [Phytophthora idaei]|nr:hypothetical protein PI125_g20405 [Phytophthora idaei]KAG3134006.1 hypothetical protein PI126_g18904 [Phytophthora idaei]KAG3236697.1 hypothetical protein PI124_g18298 [Phytophthora idaei]
MFLMNEYDIITSAPDRQKDTLLFSNNQPLVKVVSIVLVNLTIATVGFKLRSLPERRGQVMENAYLLYNFIRRPGGGVDGVRIAPNSEIPLRYFAEGCESEHLLEERSRKKQWQTGYLNKKNYATAANIFVDASAAEYVWQCLDCPLEGEEDAERKLTLQKGGKL